MFTEIKCNIELNNVNKGEPYSISKLIGNIEIIANILNKDDELEMITIRTKIESFFKKLIEEYKDEYI